jgi:hypothetical protein
MKMLAIDGALEVTEPWIDGERPSDHREIYADFTLEVRDSTAGTAAINPASTRWPLST